MAVILQSKLFLFSVLLLLLIFDNALSCGRRGRGRVRHGSHSSSSSGSHHSSSNSYHSSGNSYHPPSNTYHSSGDSYHSSGNSYHPPSNTYHSSGNSYNPPSYNRDFGSVGNNYQKPPETVRSNPVFLPSLPHHRHHSGSRSNSNVNKGNTDKPENNTTTELPKYF